MNGMYDFDFCPIREEGAPLDPIDAAMFTGPGATDEWFEKQRKAFFEHRRANGDKEEDLMRHPYYMPPNTDKA